MNRLSDDNSDKTQKLGITLPKSILHRIDQVRGDIPRSKYILRSIERYLGTLIPKKRSGRGKSKK
jgi:metal-responsive CopG/Arc/MetJ family transcriptional regulator